MRGIQSVYQHVILRTQSRRACLEVAERGRLNLRLVQISGLVNGEELTLLDKLPLQPGLGKIRLGVKVEPPEEADWGRVILCRPFRDSILFR
jgi:hypothetical protein